jgi:PadR family transcriptional regulator, regulatory protein AphA
MSLRHAMLGVLIVQPMTGYDLADYSRATDGLFWEAGQAQIYPELRRMEADGLVSAKEAPRGKLAKKRIYAITKKGVDELRRWAEEPLVYTAIRDPAHFKTNYFDIVSLDVSKAFFESHIKHHKALLSEWEDRVEGMRDRSASLLARRLASKPAADHDAIVEFRVLALEGQIGRAKAEIAWARQGLKVVDDLRSQEAMRKARGSRPPVASRARAAARARTRQRAGS